MEWLYGAKLLSSSGVQKMAEIGYAPFTMIMIASLASSLFITTLFLKFYGSKGVGSTIYRAFPMLSVAITAIFVSLQFSIPLSLGLLGALSIVRFRTPIKDPEEIGFILLIIAVSICCATFNLFFLLIVLLVAILGLLILNKDKKYFRKNTAQGLIVYAIPANDFLGLQANILKLTATHFQGKVDSIIENISEGSISYNFSSYTDEAYLNLQKEIKNLSSNIKVSLYFNSPGEI